MELDLFHDYCEIIKKINKQNNGTFSLIEKIMLALIFFLFSVGIMISSLFSYHIVGAVLLGVSIISLVIFCLLQNKKSNILIANNRHKTKETEKHQELRKLLKEYE